MRRLRILTWHVHGSYLHYLTQVPHDFFVLSRPERPPGYVGRFGHFPWGDNVHDMPVAAVADQPFDCILFQHERHYREDQHAILSAAQRRLPRIFLEHDPPRQSPTDTRHPVDDPDTLLVHVTAFNRLMWDNGRTPTRVVEHGVIAPTGVAYDGSLLKGLVVVNHIAQRGRRLGLDVFEAARAQVPLDLVGMGSAELGGLGEVRHDALPAFAARYRFFFNPIRYTSLGLAVVEAMMLGLPIVALATTEMATVIENGVSGYVETEPQRLVERMETLLAEPELARSLGENARRYALERFGIGRFIDDWCDALGSVCGAPRFAPGIRQGIRGAC